MMLNTFDATGKKTFSADSLPLCYSQTIHILNREPFTLVFEDYSNPAAYDSLYFDEGYPIDSVFGAIGGWNVEENMFPNEWMAVIEEYCDPCYYIRGYAIVDVIPSKTPLVVFPVCYNFFGNIICTSIYNTVTGMYDKILVDMYSKNLTMDYYYEGGYVSGPYWRTFNAKGSLALYVYTSGTDAKTTDCFRVYKDTSHLTLSDSAKAAKIVNSFDLRWGYYGNTHFGTVAAGSYNTSVAVGYNKSYSMPIPGDGSKRPIVLPIAQKKFGPTATSDVSWGYNETLFPWEGFPIAATERATGVYWGVFETVAKNGVWSQLRLIPAESLSFPYIRKWANPRYAWEIFYHPQYDPYCNYIDGYRFSADIPKAFILST